MNNPIEKYTFHNLVEKDDDGRCTLKIVDDNDVRLLLSDLSTYYDLFDIIKNSGEITKLVVQLKDDALKELENGAFFNTNKKTGVKWPDLMKMGDDGRYHVIKKLPMAEESFSHGDPFHKYAVLYQNMCIQQQVKNLADEIEYISKVVERIEHGQQDDRVGLLNSGRKQILRALSCEDTDYKTKELLDGRNNISIAREQILSTLKFRIESFENIPSSKYIRIIKEYVHEGYLKEKYNEYLDIYNYYSLYLLSTNLLFASYFITNDQFNSEQVYLDAKSEIKAIDYGHIKSLGNIMHKSDLFFFELDETIDNNYNTLLEQSDSFTTISLEVSKKQLMEVAYEHEQENAK